MSIYPSSRAMPYVYICTHKVTQEFYIGFRYRNVKMGLPSHEDLPIYKTSSKRVKPKFEEFEWAILAEFFDEDSAYDYEQFVIHQSWGNTKLLNGSCHYGHQRFKHGPDSAEKISLGLRGKPKTAEHNKNVGLANAGKKRSAEQCEYMRLSHTGIKHTADQNAIKSARMTGLKKNKDAVKIMWLQEKFLGKKD